jgi:transposase-like protein
MTRKARMTFTAEQKLEYAKLMINQGYTNKKIRDISGAGETAVSRWKKPYLAEVDGHMPQGKPVSHYFCQSLFWASNPKQAAKT